MAPVVLCLYLCTCTCTCTCIDSHIVLMFLFVQEVNVLIWQCANYAPLTTTPVIAFQAEFCPPSLLLSSKMKLLLSLAVLVVTLGVLNSTPDAEPISEDTLTRKFTELNFFQSNLYQCMGRIWLSSSPLYLSLYNEFYKIVYRYIISVDLCNPLLFVESLSSLLWLLFLSCNTSVYKYLTQVSVSLSQSCLWMARNWWTRRWGELCMGWNRWRRWCGGMSKSMSTSWSPSSIAMKRERWI